MDIDLEEAEYENMNPIQKSLVAYLQKVIINDPLKTNVHESYTNDLCNYIFNKLQYQEFPWNMMLENQLYVQGFGTTFSAKPEMSFYKRHFYSLMRINT